MGVKKTVSIVLAALLCIVVFYVLNNQLLIRENNLPEELRVIHFYYDAPGASRDVLSDETVTNQALIREIMDELEGRYLRLPVDEDFFGFEKQQHKLCISGPMGNCKDIDIRENGYVIIDGESCIRLSDDTKELYHDLMEAIKEYQQ